MNDFAADLQFSHDCEENKCWEEIYRKAFPAMVSMTSHKQDGWHQRAGVDRSVILSNSKQIRIDEKARRRKDTGDIMLEYTSNDKTQTPGWVEKNLICDYIAYAFIPSGKAYLFPVIQLQSAWAKNKSTWLARYDTKSAVNHGYNTLNCPVPTDELFRAIGQCLRVEFNPVVQ